MINWLRVAKSAYFYKRKRRLPKNAIVELFRALRQNSQTPSNNIFQHVKEIFAGTSWSAIAFSHERDPSFLELPPGQARERVCGFLLLVEYRDHLVLFRSGFDVPSTFKTRYLQRVADDRLQAAVARADATFEQIRLRNMAGSKYMLRSKTLEANDLQNVVGPSGASRYVPHGYRVRRGEEHYSATPTTGRISLRSDRTDHEELIHWAVAVINGLIDETAAPSTFIRSFARPVDLGSLPSSVHPAYLAMDIATLTEELFEEPVQYRLVRRAEGVTTALAQEEAQMILIALDLTFAIQKVRGQWRITELDDAVQVGTLEVGKTRIALRSFAIAEIQEIYIEPTNQAAGEESPALPLKRHIDHNDLFTVLFNDFAIVYLNGTLYRDDSMTDGGQTFLSYIRSNNQLSTATSEKGTFSAAQTSFDDDAVFGILVNSIATGDEVLVCDDLGDEWADFIGVNGQSQPKTISFYHAKHGALSLGASSFHVAVGHAIKNLGRFNITPEAIGAKLPKWSATYSAANLETSIPRIVRADAATLEQSLNDALSSPDTIRRVFLVTSSLSRWQLEEAFANIQDGHAPTAYFVQLYSLLMGYFTACAEVGAYPYVICQE
jgi:hypothetical protein